MKTKDLMTRRAWLAGMAAGAGALAAPRFVQAQQPPRLDVPYVPTAQHVVDRMLTIAKVTKDDFVMDLGCGDGRMLVTAAAKFGAKGGYGVDINPERIKEAKANALKAGVADKVTFEIRDLFTMPINQASVLTMYLLPSVNLKLRPRILDEMKPGSRIVSHDFNMDDWRPDYFEAMEGHDIYFWIVPAKAEGEWAVRIGDDDYTLSVQQKFQYFVGSLRAVKTRQESLIRMGRINGSVITFIAEGDDGRSQLFSGRIDGARMTFDTSTLPAAVEGWSAEKKK